MNDEEMFSLIKNNEIGNDTVFNGPFGLRKIVYCDYTASGKPLKFIEDYIKDEVFPNYANTHTTTSKTSFQTTVYRDEARSIIKKCVNANDNDALIFSGSGCTGAIHKLKNVLELKERPIVFTTHYEHHSNLLTWRESCFKIVTTKPLNDGTIDYKDLEDKLKQYSTEEYANYPKIGSFSAASNITGLLTDVNRTSILMHKYNGLAFFDFASAGPYENIDMNPEISGEDKHLVYKDAVFIATHKFVGGPQTPGILVAKEKLFRNLVPNNCGGGTVVFVTQERHEYLSDIESREEGGTPAIIESIRAGLVFHLKNACGVDNIMKREHLYAEKAIKFLKKLENLILLGSHTAPRVPIFSFLILHKETGLYLHHSFVSSLLNDLFGIQIRSGCACAGPYAQHLLGIDAGLAEVYIKIFKEVEIFKPGFSRFNLAYFMDMKRVDFILNAVKFVSEHGWKFLTVYDLDLRTNQWRHKNFNYFDEIKSLNDISYGKEGLIQKKTKNKLTSEHTSISGKTYNDILATAKKEVEKIMANKPETINRDDINLFSKEKAPYRWFLLPSEAMDVLFNENHDNIKVAASFVPLQYLANHEDSQ